MGRVIAGRWFDGAVGTGARSYGLGLTKSSDLCYVCTRLDPPYGRRSDRILPDCDHEDDVARTAWLWRNSEESSLPSSP